MMLRRFLGVVGALMALLLFALPVWADMDLEISCEGTRSTGGGTYEYQYTLKNTTGSSVTLLEFYVGTEDGTIVNYSFVPTAGFTPSIIANDAYPPVDVLWTSQTKTPHGVVPPAIGVYGTTSGFVLAWTGAGTAIPPGGTITFAFDHPNAPWDQEWHARADAGWTIGQSDSPMAGPTGVYGDGYVHCVGPEAADIPTLSTWGLIIMFALLLLAATAVLIRRRRYSPEGAQ